MRQGAAPPASCAPRPRWPWPRSACWRCPPPPPPPTSGQCPPRPGPPAFPSSRCSKANFSLPLALAPAGSRTQTLAPVVPSPISGSEFAPELLLWLPRLGRGSHLLASELWSPSPPLFSPCPVRDLIPPTRPGLRPPTQAPGLCRRFGPCPGAPCPCLSEASLPRSDALSDPHSVLCPPPSWALSSHPSLPGAPSRPSAFAPQSGDPEGWLDGWGGLLPRPGEGIALIQEGWGNLRTVGSVSWRAGGNRAWGKPNQVSDLASGDFSGE